MNNSEFIVVLDKLQLAVNEGCCCSQYTHANIYWKYWLF